MRLRFVDESRATWSVQALCRNLGVTAAGYYAWRGRPASARAQANATLAAEARAAFAEAKGRYGSPRRHRSLLARGVRCGVNAVAKALKALGLAACRPRRRPRPPGSGGAEGDATPNTLGRQFAAARADQKWVSDITSVATGEGWLYLAAVEDLFRREIVGWAMSATMTSRRVVDALGMAVTKGARTTGGGSYPPRGRVRAGVRGEEPPPDGPTRRGVPRPGDCRGAVTTIGLEPLRGHPPSQRPPQARVLRRAVPGRAVERPHPAGEDRHLGAARR